MSGQQRLSVRSILKNNNTLCDSDSGELTTDDLFPIKGSTAFALPYFEDVISSLRHFISEKSENFRYSIDIHTTLSRPSYLDVSPTLTDSETQVKSRYAALAPYITVNWAQGRPSISDVIQTNKSSVGNATGQKGERKMKMAVISCGPAGFVDDCRFAAAEADRKSDGARVDYFEESFTW